MATDVETILKLKVPLLVTVGERFISVDEVLALGPGAILELERSSDSDLILMVNNKTIGTGHAVKVGENFGIKINHVDSAEDRIAALASEEAEG
jgi:flagellar motor switch protein FliN